MLGEIILHGDDLLFPVNLLVTAIGSEGTVKSAITRKQIISVKRGLYAFSALGQWQTKVLSFLGYNSFERLLADIKAGQQSQQQNETKAAIEWLPSKWATFYIGTDEHFYLTQLPIDGAKARDLAHGMAILRLMAACERKSDIKLLTGLNTKDELIHAVALKIKELNLYGLPASYDRLRCKLYDYQAAIKANNDPREVLISRKFGNTNTLKRTEEHEALMLEFYCNPKKLDIFESYNNYAYTIKKELGLEPLSLSAMKAFLNTEEIKLEVSRSRHGNSYYEVFVRPFMLRKEPEFSFSLIAGDGWMPGHSVKHTFNGKTKVGGMTVWVWFDWRSSAILSYKIGPSESSDMIRRSFRDILNLHGGKVPMSVMMDKKWTENPETARMLEKAGVIIQDKRAYNPKASKAERFNKELNKIHRRIDEFWVSMTNHTANFTHNPEHVREGKALEESEFRAMIRDVVNIHNNTPLKRLNGKTPLQEAADSVNPNSKTLDALHRTWIFGDKTIVTVKNGWFKIQIASKKYEFILSDPLALATNNVKNGRVKVYYDEAFMDTVDIYSFTDEDSDMDDRYLCTCQTAARVNAAHVEMTEADEHILGQHLQRGKKVDAFIDDKAAKREKVMKSLSLDTASVHSVSQERYKEALGSDMAKLYSDFYEDVDREEGVAVIVKPAAKTMTAKEKLALMEKQYRTED